MTQYPFIFSDLRKYRLQRHIAFWLFWGLFQGFLYSFATTSSTGEYLKGLPGSVANSFIFLLVHIFLSYSLMYFVIPRFLIKQRYWLASFWVLLLFLVTALLSLVLSVWVVPALRNCFFSAEEISEFRSFQRASVNIFLGLLAGLRGGITIGGIASAIKLMKYWYMKEQRNLQLQKENVATQLQVLKAQVHPHFLFNTLNNIYSYAQNFSPVTPKLVMGLSDMLRYMLYECNKPLVPLSKEIKMLHDYCSLEKVRYDKHLSLQVNTPVLNDELQIAPLLLLPFVENCFKHGASNLLEDAWVSITITTEGEQLKMKLINSKPPAKNNYSGKTGGLGISNVKKRLQLLYEDRYDLQVTDEDEIFIVTLQLQLDKISPVRIMHKPQKIPATYEPR